MDKLIELARKMEQQQATPEHLAKAIVSSYKQMDRQRDELKGVSEKRLGIREPLATGVNKTVSSQQRQSSDKKKLNRTGNLESHQQRPDAVQQQPSKIARPMSSRKPSQQLVETQSKKIAVSFRQQDKEFQLFSLKLLCEKLNKVRLLIGRVHAKQAMSTLKAYYKYVTMRENEFILRRARRLMAKYFGMLHKQTIIQKLERENEQAKRQMLKQKQQDETADDFRQYRLYVKALHGWKRYSRLVRIQRKRIEEETVEAISKKQQPQKSELKSKVSDFLSNLKKDIEGQNKRPIPPAPRIIVEVPDEMVESLPTQSARPEEEEPNHEIVNQQQYYEQLIHAEPSAINDLPVNSTVQPAPHIPGRKLTHDELLKRRDELQKKSKQRKERLQQIRKEKQEQRVKLQEQRKLSQQRFKQQQAKRKQQQYQRFLKRKKEEQQARENEIKEIERQQRLHQFAEVEDRNRLKKFFGWLPWRKLIQQRNSNFEKLAVKLDKAVLKLHWLRFQERYKLRCQALEKKEEQLTQRAALLRRKHCKRHTLSLLKEFNRRAGDERIELLSRHCSHTQRIVFNSWKRVMPQLIHENYEEQKRVTAKVEQFRNGFLLSFCFKSLMRNKEEQKRDRLMALHRNNLKGKISQWTKDDRELDVDKLLQ